MNKLMASTIAASALFATGNDSAPAAEFHVAQTGKDSNPGTQAAPFRTIQRAANQAQPGDVITVHEGIYRERINPPRGGDSDARRIVYQAAPGAKVDVRGSEPVKNWARIQGDVWKVMLPNSFFGDFNPYNDLIRGDWFDARGRQHHTGAVYLNGHWLTEAATLDDVMKPVGANPLWFARVESGFTTIWAQFKGVDPNTQLSEINVRQAVFYPDKPGRNFITVRGFALRHAATPWAPPTAVQVGLIGTHWSRGWIIENNVVSHSVCSGIALGKYGDQFDNTSANTAEGYVKTIERALANGWNKATIGQHIVRNNTIGHCEQTGIVGSLGSAFCTVTGNTIHDIHVRRLFSGAEMAGIKFHAAIDTVIQGNHIHHTCRGLWLDWMAQGTRVSGNLLHDNASEDLFVEVDHGPFMVDNNLLLSNVSVLDMSEGGAYAHNLFAGKIVSRPEPGRETPYHPAHTTTVAGLATIKGGDNRFFNNVFVGAGAPPRDQDPAADAKDPEWRGGYGLWVYNFREYPTLAGGNIYLNGAKPLAKEADAIVRPHVDPKLKLDQEGNAFTLHFAAGRELASPASKLVTTTTLGKAKVPGVGYESADGSPFAIDTDFLGAKRSGPNPTPGPFEAPEAGALTLKLR